MNRKYLCAVCDDNGHCAFTRFSRGVNKRKAKVQTPLRVGQQSVRYSKNYDHTPDVPKGFGIHFAQVIKG